MSAQPLAGVQVLDFSTLLPGPLCSLLLCEAGAGVLKIERAGMGDDMRGYVPRFGQDSVNFALLNRGKKSLALDLKAPAGLARALELARSADVVIEQFRPGVMDRLGLGYEALKRVNPRIVYCSISGYGQHGPLANHAAHDLNYVADSGMLTLCATQDGELGLPHALLADIGGGAYPATMNILLALRSRDANGEGCHLDIAMCENLFTFMYWGLGEGFAASRWPTPGSGLVTGATPRYQVYRTSDGRTLAAAPLEDKFWANFLRVLGAEHLQDDSQDPSEVRDAIAGIIATATGDEWMTRFEGVDACVNIAQTLQDAVQHPHFASRGVFEQRVVNAEGASIPALPVPIAPAFRRCGEMSIAPALGEAT